MLKELSGSPADIFNLGQIEGLAPESLYLWPGYFVGYSVGPTANWQSRYANMTSIKRIVFEQVPYELASPPYPTSQP